MQTDYMNYILKYGKFEKDGSEYNVVEIRNVPKDDTELNQILTDNAIEISEYSEYKNEIQKFLFLDNELNWVIGKDDTGEYVGFFKNGLEKSYKIGEITDKRIEDTGLTSEDIADIEEAH